MKRLLSKIMPIVPKAVVFQTHQVVRVFQTAKVMYESKKMPRLLSWRYKRGMKATKANGARPRTGHAAAIKRPLNTASPTFVNVLIT